MAKPSYDQLYNLAVHAHALAHWAGRLFGAQLTPDQFRKKAYERTKRLRRTLTIAGFHVRKGGDLVDPAGLPIELLDDERDT